jgi:excinuclease ABC subunit C
MDLPDKVKEKLRDLPDAPGCYLMRDARGRIVYVGKAASLRKRVGSYFRRATLRSADPKLRGLLKSVADLELVVVRTEAEAALTEGRLIKDYRPRYNVSFRDDKRFLMLRGDATEPLPVLKLRRLRRPDAAAYFGPYASAAAARVTLDFVEKRFGLRKCAPREPDAETYRHCINDIVRFCSAPCVGRVTPEAYRQRFEEACAFLRGERLAPLADLRARMEEAAKALDFERAAALRDTLLRLNSTVRERARAAATPDLRADAARAGVRDLQTALGLPRRPARIEAFDISNISGTFAVASLVCAVDGLPRRNRYRRFRIRTVEGADDPAMMAEVVRRRYTRVLAEHGERPDLVLVDGGVAQLGAARAELDRLGLSDLPVAGLAKRDEEIHVLSAVEPIRLPKESGALLVLRRLRDEAHRFALTYHRRLRERVVRESVLDEFAGIGDKRKRALLARFGSVRRLTDATVEDVAATPGVGAEFARALLEWLRRRREAPKASAPGPAADGT